MNNEEDVEKQVIYISKEINIITQKLLKNIYLINTLKDLLQRYEYNTNDGTSKSHPKHSITEVEKYKENTTNTLKKIKELIKDMD